MDRLKWIRGGVAALVLLGMASCAKENLPDAEPELKSYNKIYFVQASLSGNINFKVYVDANKRDTAFNVVNITVGGTAAPDHDIPVQFETLGQAYVDAYNTQKGMTAKLLPEANFSLDRDVVIKKGTLTTGTLPLQVKLDGLSNGDVYVLPVKFNATDPAHPVDPQLQIAYYVFTCQQMPVGKYIGNIPQINEPGVRVFEFYDDLMLRDTAGNLWVYPLKGRQTLGEPVQVASGFENVTSLFFNSGYKRLIGVITTGSYLNCVVSWSVTNVPDVKIGDTLLAYKSADFVAVFSDTFFPGVNGAWYGVHATGNSFWYFTLNASGTAATRSNINTGWVRDIYKDPCIINNAVVVNHPTGLLVYLLAANGATFATDRWMVGKGFFKYSRIFSFQNKDLIAIKANGDLIRYADFDIHGTYVAEL